MSKLNTMTTNNHNEVNYFTSELEIIYYNVVD